jgi:predicted GNAT family N-acyltransferase
MQPKKSRLAHIKQPDIWNRKNERRDIYASDGIVVYFPDFKMSGRVYDISPFGFGVECEEQNELTDRVSERLIASASKLTLRESIRKKAGKVLVRSKAAKIKLRGGFLGGQSQLGGQRGNQASLRKNEVNFMELKKLKPGEITSCVMSYVTGQVECLAVVCWTDLGDGGEAEEKANQKLRIGFRFHPKYADVENREGLVLSESAVVSGNFFAAAAYYERYSFHLMAIGKDLLRIRIFEQALLIVPGQKMELFFHLWNDPKYSVKTEVVRAEQDDNLIYITLKILEFPKGLKAKLGDFLFEMSDVTMKEIRAAGLQLTSAAEKLRFRYIRTEAEYIDVLQLRYKAYKEAGKVVAGRTYRDMAAPLDHMSRILAAYHGDKLVASAAMCFPNDESTVLDTERPFGQKYPKPIPPKRQCMEVSRLCTDSDYRGSDLLQRVMEHLYKGMHCGDRLFVITSSDEKLWPLYRRMGFKKLKMSYDHPYLAGMKHHIIMADRSIGDSAGANPLAWFYFYSRMNSHLRLGAILSQNLIGYVRAKIYKKIVVVLLKLIGKA